MIQQTPASLRISLVQTALAWEQPDANLDALASKLEPLAGKTDLVVLPETFATGFTSEGSRFAEDMGGRPVAWIVDQARRLDAAVVGSVFISESGGVRNRLLWATPDGSLEHYDKRHLFRMGGEHLRYVAGDGGAQVITWRGVRVCPLVCYDLRFPVWSRRRPDLDYEVLLYVANWPAARAYAWSQLLRARAIENQAIVIGVNRVGTDGRGIPHVGGSGVFDGWGQPVVELGSEPAVETVTADLASLREFRDRFPVHLDADPFTLAAP